MESFKKYKMKPTKRYKVRCLKEVSATILVLELTGKSDILLTNIEQKVGLGIWPCMEF